MVIEESRKRLVVQKCRGCVVVKKSTNKGVVPEKESQAALRTIEGRKIMVNRRETVGILRLVPDS